MKNHQGTEELPVKKKKPRRGCLFAIIILLLSLLWYGYASMKVERENHFRTSLMVTLREKIEDYHKVHNEYPEDLLVMTIESGELIEEYIESKVLRYSRDPSGRQWYRLVGCYSGILSMKAGDGKHNLSWSGIQYSNRTEQLDLMQGEALPDKNDFYRIDLH